MPGFFVSSVVKIFTLDELLSKCITVKPPDGDTEEMGSHHVKKTPSTVNAAEAQ